MDNCKICNSEVEYCFNGLVLKKYDVRYYRCSNCGFIQTESPYWLEEAYSSVIASLDIGLTNRNLTIAPILSGLIRLFFKKSGMFIDYGGGYGMLTRIMRDVGFDFYRFDIYCENIFAKNHDVDLSYSNDHFELLTAFEVFEHLVDPVSELEKMLKLSNNIFFSTEVQTSPVNSDKDWWYVMPETGQHIALFTSKALNLLAEKYNLNFYTNERNLHLFTSKKINPLLFKFILKLRLAKLWDIVSSNKRSLLNKDYEMLRQQN